MLLLQNKFKFREEILVMIGLSWCCKCPHQCSQHPPRESWWRTTTGRASAFRWRGRVHLKTTQENRNYYRCYLPIMHPQSIAETLPGGQPDDHMSEYGQIHGQLHENPRQPTLPIVIILALG